MHMQPAVSKNLLDVAPTAREQRPNLYFTSAAISKSAALDMFLALRNPLLPRRGADADTELPLMPQ